MSSNSRKRQRVDIDIHIATPSTRQGPILALFPASQPSATTPFTVYTKAKRKVIAGESDVMEWDSRNHIGTGEAGGEGQVAGESQGYSTQYMMGVHNPRTGTLTLHSAPVHAFSTSVKQLKSTPGIVSASLMGAQRALLGATFGTKKAIRSINADARNKLTHESYGVGKETQGLMAESITIGAASLPIKSVIEATADLARPIPPPNFDAQTPDEVYDMDDVVTPIELECINIDPFLMARSYKERSNLLPFRHSKFINTRLKNLLPTPEGLAEDEPIPLRNKDKKRLRYLIHISYLMAFRSAASGGRASSLERSNLLERLGSPAPVIIDALLDRYTELQRSGTSHEAKVTGTMEIKLMGYLMILVLKVDKFGTDVGVIAEDLKLPPKRAQELFRSLGCVLLAPSSEERNALVSSGVAATNAEARSSKRAVLRVPLVFPKETRGQPKR